jgi:hypothetical protein
MNQKVRITKSKNIKKIVFRNVLMIKKKPKKITENKNLNKSFNLLLIKI